MKFARETLANGTSRMVDATGQPLGHGDADRPILHILPKLLVPAQMLGRLHQPFDGLEPEEITLSVTSTLPVDVLPEGGIQIRQPYPNRRYFVGGSTLLRNGWIIPLPLDATEFDLSFEWRIDSASIWQIFPKDDWLVRHLIHVQLHPGKGLTYSLDGSNWPQRKGPAMFLSPVSILGIGDKTTMDLRQRQILRESDLLYADGERQGELAGYFLEEKVNITGIPMEQAWSIDAFQDEQLHEVRQTAKLTQDLDAHRINGPVEMPAQVFLEAVNLAEAIAFDDASDFAQSVSGVPGGLERHPAMKRLCDWWETVRPAGEPFKPGSAMPLVRIRDDGQYWWAYHEIPNTEVAGFNPSGRDAARIGDQVLVLFQAAQDHANFDEDGMHIFLPSGAPFATIGISKAEYLSGETDEAWACLSALAAFRGRFPAAWQCLNDRGGDYLQRERAAVAKPVPPPEGLCLCTNCDAMPTITEDPTGRSGIRYLLTCGDHVSIAGDSLEGVVDEWAHHLAMAFVESGD